MDHAAPSDSGTGCSTAELERAAGISSGSLDRELTDLYRSFAARLFRYGILLARDAGLAQEAVQESFLRYYVQRNQGGIRAERAWLFRVARNYILDQQKTLSTRTSVSLDAARACQDRSHSPDKAFERLQAIQQAFEVLSPRELECLQLRTEGFSYKEISAVLGIGTGTVGALLARGADKIRRAFGEEGLPCEAV